jgi:hypothetical protein
VGGASPKSPLRRRRGAELRRGWGPAPIRGSFAISRSSLESGVKSAAARNGTSTSSSTGLEPLPASLDEREQQLIEPFQTVRRPLRHLAAYGSTNKSTPLNRSKAIGSSARRPTQKAGPARAGSITKLRLCVGTCSTLSRAVETRPVTCAGRLGREPGLRATETTPVTQVDATPAQSLWGSIGSVCAQRSSVGRSDPCPCNERVFGPCRMYEHLPPGLALRVTHFR